MASPELSDGMPRERLRQLLHKGLVIRPSPHHPATRQFSKVRQEKKKKRITIRTAVKLIIAV